MTIDALPTSQAPTATRVVHGRGVHLDLPADGRLPVVPWRDPVVDLNGEPATGDYVEWFWLPVLGPTATWVLRRLATQANETTDPVAPTIVDLAELAGALGVTWQPGHEGPFSRALTRCVMFGACAPIADVDPLVLAVRLAMPHLPARHAARLPASLRAAHREWEDTLRLARTPSRGGGRN